MVKNNQAKGNLRISAILKALSLASIACLRLEGEETQLPVPEPKPADLGEFSMRLQGLNMGRDFGYAHSASAQLHSGTVALTADYKSPVYHGFSLGFQYIHVEDYYTTGDRAAFGNQDPGYLLSNSDFSILNHAFVRFDFQQAGLEGSWFSVGRQTLNTSYATPYGIRQKDQAFEAAILQLGHLKDIEISLGHLEKFSSWSSRDDRSAGVTANGFIDVERTENVPYSTSGIQFIDITYKGLPRTEVTVYDYFGDDLYNTFGMNLTYTLASNQSATTDLRLKTIYQSGNGEYIDFLGQKLQSQAIQASVRWKRGDFRWEPGVFLVGGSGGENTIRSPFAPPFIIEEPMIETDLGFEAGSLSFYFEGNHRLLGNDLYFMYLYTDTKSVVFPGTSREFDFILSRFLDEHFYVKLKLAIHNYRDDIVDNTVFDYRVFLGWQFGPRY